MVLLKRASLMEEEWSCYRGCHEWRGNGYVTEEVRIMEGEWSCYRGGLFNRGGIVMLHRTA